MVAVINQVPKPDKVTSWKTARFPKGFLRQDIQTDWDATTKSVVIGPSKAPWLNQLHEFGGGVGLWFIGTKYPVTEYRGKKLPKSVMADGKQGRDSRGRFLKKRVGAYLGYLSNRPIGNSIPLGTKTVRGRGYMEIGLQAMIHRIPAQFQDTIRRSGGSIGR